MNAWNGVYRSLLKLKSFRKYSPVVLGSLVPLVFLAIWEYLAFEQIINPIFFPPPTKLLEIGLALSLDGTLVMHVQKTLGRLAPAFLIGSILGLVAGLLLGSSQKTRTLLEPSFLAIYSVPKIALLPIFLAAFGVGESALVGLITTSVFFYVWIYTMSAAMRTPENILRTARAFGASRLSILTSVILRSALPETMTGVRVGVTVSLLVCLTAEYILGADGIGYLILGSRSLGQHALSYLGIFVAAITGVLLQIGVKTLDNLLNPGVKKLHAIN